MVYCCIEHCQKAGGFLLLLQPHVAGNVCEADELTLFLVEYEIFALNNEQAILVLFLIVATAILQHLRFIRKHGVLLEAFAVLIS